MLIIPKYQFKRWQSPVMNAFVVKKVSTNTKTSELLSGNKGSHSNSDKRGKNYHEYSINNWAKPVLQLGKDKEKEGNHMCTKQQASNWFFKEDNS